MQNTFKKSTFLYIAAVFLLPFFVRVTGLHFPIHPAIITVPVFAFLAYRSYRSGTMPASASPTTPSVRGPSQTQMIAILSVIAVVLIGYSVRTGHLFVAGISKPPIEGAYRDKSGAKVEFVGDGSLLVTNGTNTDTARWSRMDDTRIRLEPAQIGFLGQVCEYRFRSYGDLSIAGCDFRMNLTRM
ncbi:hypothetical protein QA648_17865 [Rhizobium sp. CB3171]|uniref:hypothetical protein n=1 Tax=Rhizobium sp. CB3171 TaxID=3039157 RepID=UPI0024B1F1DF|nr:hypothetical protein [Rhizobium sp. CB3171]WFU01944.1 hypothetical protein QA648_17865 [Rhizobium sp. CB3171]